MEDAPAGGDAREPVHVCRLGENGGQGAGGLEAIRRNDCADFGAGIQIVRRGWVCPHRSSVGLGETGSAEGYAGGVVVQSKADALAGERD